MRADRLIRGIGGNPAVWYWWRGYLQDGTVIEQYTRKGDEHTVRDLQKEIPFLKCEWVPFSVERAKAVWQRGIVAVPTVRQMEEERPAAVLESPDGRTVLPYTEVELSIPIGAGVPIHRAVEYVLEHPCKRVTLDLAGRVREEVLPGSPVQGQGLYTARGPVVMPERVLDEEFDVRRKRR